MNNNKVRVVLCARRGVLLFLLVLQALSCKAYATLTVTPSTWNIVGLDSNTPASGPNRFPVGAKVCSDILATNVDVTFTWDSANSNVNLTSGTANPYTIPSISAGGCAEAYFEVEVTQISASYDTSRRYHITAGGVSTPTPRELYVEHLVSQARNYITDIKLNGASIPAGGSLNVVVGNTYTIELLGGTATQGYNQFEMFLNFPNSIFQVVSVSTTYSADDGPYVSSPNDKIYADACQWENDPNSPNYRACSYDYKAGGSNVVTTYTVKIIGGGGTSQNLTALLYDFSGSSFHYNSDQSTGARILNVIDPSTVTISKNFSPDPATINGISALTFTLTNPNPGTVSGVNFTDTFPVSPGAMVVANPPSATTTGCGTPTFAPTAGAASISFSNGTISGNSSCTVKVNVTTPSTGTYTNTSDHVFVNTVDTGSFATDTLTVNNNPPPGTGLCGNTMASWDFPTGFTVTAPVATVANVTASAASGAGVTPIDSTANYSGTTHSWGANGSIATGGTLTTTNNDYFEFSLDTTNYTTVYVHFWAERKINNSPKGVAVYYGTSTGNPETGTSIYDNATVLAANTTWYEFGAADSLSIPVTSATTYVRIYFYNSGNTNPGSDAYMDDVMFTGCNAGNQPTITKAFSPDPVAVNGISTLTFTLTNPNAAQLTGAKFTDTLPSGLEVDATPSASTTCTGSPTWTPAAAATTLEFGQTTGGNIPASGSCTASVNVKSTTSGPHNNVSGFISTTETGTNKNSLASATLTAVLPPSIAKGFAPDPILPNGVSTLTFTITNPNQNNSLSGIAFSDTFPTSPGSMVVAATPNGSTSGCGTPTFSPVAGAGSISFSAGTIAAGGTCTVSVDITAPVTGTYNNTSGNVSHDINAQTVNGNTASDSLTVKPASPGISLLKQVSPSATGPWTSFLALATGGNVYYKFTIENIGDVPLNPVSVSDPDVNTSGCSWPSPLPVAVPANDNHIATCVVGPVSAIAGSHTNTATASGTYSGNPYTDISSATYATTGLTIAKSATQTYFAAAGNVLNYSYLVTNSGFAALGGPVTIADDKSTNESCPALTTVGDFDNFLDPGEQITCTATYTVTAADVTAKQVTNIASATVSGVTSPTDSKTVPLAADLTSMKTNNVNGLVGVGDSFAWTITVSNAVSAGSSASFADTQTLLTDELPTTGETFAVGTVTKSGTTGTINCSIASNTLTCTASGAVTIPPSLQGTVSVTNSDPVVTGAGTSFTTQLTAGSIILISGVPYTVLSIQNDSQITLTTNYAGGTAGGLSIPGSFSAPVTVTTTAARTLDNPRSGGMCRADSGTVIPEISDANNDCSNTVTVQLSPTISISFNPVSIPKNGSSVLTITITNPDPGVGLTSVGLTNNYPANLVNTATPGGTTTCAGGSVSASAGGSSVSLSGASIPASTNCNITVNVTSATAGSYTNTIPVSTLTSAEGRTNLSAASGNIAVLDPPTVAKSFNPTQVELNNASVLTVTLTNPNTTAITGAAFTDTYPANLVNTATPGGATTCAGGAVTATAGGNSLALSGGTIPASGSCTVTVNVTSATGGDYNNSTGSVTTTNAGTGSPASATLSVLNMPDIVIVKSVLTQSDPVNNTTNPKAIPGAEMLYTITATNTGEGTAGTIVLTDAIPSNAEFFAGDINGVGSGPILFEDGAIASGLSYSFISLSSGADSPAFSNDGATYTYTPVPDGSGYDSNVTNIKISLTGTFNGASGGNNPSFSVKFKVRVK